MSENSKIEWTTHTFNPWIGCTHVSPGCKNCYADELDRKRFSKTIGGATSENPIPHFGKGAPRYRTLNWKDPIKWNRAYDEAFECREEALEIAPPGSILPLLPSRPRVFCASLSDWLDDEVPVEWLADLLKLIHDTPNLDWLLLSKRPENWRNRISMAMDYFSSADSKKGSWQNENAWAWLHNWSNTIAPSNVWIGTTVENQEYADIRIPELLNIPAKVRFLSVEPMLGPIDLKLVDECCRCGESKKGYHDNHSYTPMELGPKTEINWVICGGESGPKRRPMNIEWSRSLRDQCAKAGVAFFMKQIDKVQPIPEDLMIRQYPEVAR